jgi:translation initiation factor 2 subunit 3
MTTTLTIYESDVLQRQATHLIGTLGHVSEGKSTFIRSLTGIKTQRHQKEQIRNITIHLGYANCKVYQDKDTGELQALKTNDPPPSNSELVAHLSFVDCPGHEAFLATMLGGASIMDTACLIIASNQQTIPQPQTLEHLIAAHLMGLERFIILQNKLDLITQEEAKENHTKIKAFLKDSLAEHSPLFPVSAQHGWNIQDVLESLMTLEPKERKLNEPSQLTVVRSFDVNKPCQWTSSQSKMNGGVIGGTLAKGVLVVGDWIEMKPGFVDTTGKVHPLLTQITKLRCEDTELPYAIPGSLIAIETTLDPSLTGANACVGQRIGVPGSLPPIVGEITIQFKNLKRDMFEFKKAKSGERVKVCANVMTVDGTVTEMIDKKTRVIVLDKPLCVGVGETVSIMRFNTEAGRELLEGCGVVKDVEEWPDVAPFTVEPVLPNREIEWVPLKKLEFNAQPYNYDSLLENLYEAKDELFGEDKTKAFRLKEPVLEKIPKHTVWSNWKIISESLGHLSYIEHLKDWLCEELATDANVNGQGQLILKGIWKITGICNLLRKYVTMFKKCKQCQGTHTYLVTQNKMTKVWCERCKTDNFVDTS